jgi:hypothetical protein
MPYVPALAKADYGAERGEDLTLPDEIRKAVIVHRGRLTDRFQYLESAVQTASASAV